MSYDEERQRRSRVVVETPTARREEYYTQTQRVPQDRGGYSMGVVAAVALTAIALTAIVVFFFMNWGSDATQTNVNLSASAPATPIPTVPTPYMVQQPTPMLTPPPQTIIVQPAPTDAQPIVVAPPPASAATPPSPALVDADIESKINRAFTDDDQIGPGVTATVINGRVTLNGLVKTAEQKARAEQVAKGVRGARTIDNKIMIEAAPPE